MIRSFGCAETRRLFETGSSRRFSSIAVTASRKLAQLHAAETLAFLAAPPGNRLEALKGSLSGHYSIRINAQWRLLFRWTPQGPEDVKILDYH